jgi:hypothetical protein
LTVRCRSNGQRRWGGGLTGEGGFLVRALLVVDGGEVPVINGGDGVVDDNPGVTASTRVRLATSETSCGGGEWWPETETAREGLAGVLCYTNQTENHLYDVRETERKVWGEN